jgi:hypothetical protein
MGNKVNHKKKVHFRHLGLLLGLIALAGLLAGCGKGGDDGAAETTGENEYTVTFYDGDTVITTKKAASGSTVAEIIPDEVGYSKDGATFGGWYATKDYTHAFDFGTVIDKDTNIYSQWVSAQQDDRQWLIAGESQSGGPLQIIGWNGGAVDKDGVTNIFAKEPDKNEFILTIDLYVGDQFQICLQDENGAWLTDDQGVTIARGGQYLAANDYMAGASGGLGAGQANIVVSEAGNYTLTLTTDPVDNNFGEITVTRNGDAPDISLDRSDYTWYLYGYAAKGQEAASILKDMNWGSGYDTEAGLTDPAPYAMKKISDNKPDGTGTWLLTGQFDVGDEFLLAYLTVNGKQLSAEEGTLFKYDSVTKWNGMEDNFEAMGMGNNIGVKVAGTYTMQLTVTLDTASGLLKGDIEIWDNADILKKDNDWKVLGSRLTFEQATGADPMPALTVTEDEYKDYVSDIADNNWGLGGDVKSMAKVASPSAGNAAEYELTLTLDEGDFFYFAIPITVYEVSREDAYVTGGYQSTVTPGRVEGNLPKGISSVWTNNFCCIEAGSYTFTVKVSDEGQLSIAVK